MLSDYKEGMVVQATGAVGSIANENDEYIVTAYLGVNDRPRVNIGDSVNVEVAGLAQNVYGNLKGTLVSVDNDLSSSQDGKESFFKARIKIDKPKAVPDNASQSLKYKSQNTDVVTVDDKGLITAVNNGNTSVKFICAEQTVMT